MEQIVEQIAREVMMKLKSQSSNRGGSYTPPQTAGSQGRPTASGCVAVLVTANFKVVDQVMQQIGAVVPQGGRLLVSDYMVDNVGVKSLGGSVQVHTSRTMNACDAIRDISELVIPSLSLNTLSKAANLIADSYATQIISYALCEGIPVTVTDESLLDASRYFPSGVARKIDSFRRDLEGMGVRFSRGGIVVKPEHKCTTCTGTGSCGSCSTGTTSSTPAFSPLPVKTDSPQATGACLRDNCPRTYGSCASNCPSSVKQVIAAGADRIEKGHDAIVPPAELARYIDHTLLKPTATTAEITKLCDEARQARFASVCVNPAYVGLAAKLLAGSGVMVCTVVGFPLGATSSFTKAMETRDAIANGADEIDMVINVGALKSKDYELVKSDIARVVEAANGHTVKVILETSLLTDEEKVKGCELSKAAGADFVKTSTGFSSGGATAADIALMRKTVGPTMGVKASGGIRDTQTAQQMVAAGATRIGASASVAIIRGNAPAAGGAKGY